MGAVSRARLALLLVIVIVIPCIFSGCGEVASAVSTVAAPEPAVSDASAREPQTRRGIETILVMGIDSYERLEDSQSYINNIQCDFLLLLVLDREKQQISPVHINRDTMAKITRLGVFGNTARSFEGQLALAHAYGSGGADSALNVVRAVSNFLEGVKIDHYMSFTMESVAIINDMVGGVTVTIRDDFSAVDPTLEMGKEVTLRGEQALTFVRSRSNVGDSTNASRMERQREYLTGLYEGLMTSIREDEDFAQRMVRKLGDGFRTDCTVTQLDRMMKNTKDYTVVPFISVEGELTRGEKFMEFRADPDSVHSIVQELFYDPS